MAIVAFTLTCEEPTSANSDYQHLGKFRRLSRNSCRQGLLRRTEKLRMSNPNNLSRSNAAMVPVIVQASKTKPQRGI